MTEHAIVLLETSGNQRFIFATNRLRENVGASEQVYRSCRAPLVEALHHLDGPALPSTGPDVADAILNPAGNPRIEGGVRSYEVVVAGSGIATVLAATRDHGVRLVEAVTRAALADAPGLTVRGAVEPYDPTRAGALREAERRARRRLREIRAELPSPDARHLWLPIVAECATSGLPAGRVDPDRDRPGRQLARSAVSHSKHNAAQRGLERQRDLLAPELRQLVPRQAEELENLLQQGDGARWLGVLHADGNGMGHRFVQLSDAPIDDREYVERLRALSLAVDRCSLEAFRAAADALHARRGAIGMDGRLPLLPLVLGGDDVTILLDGREAIAFTIDFLHALEAVSSDRLVGVPMSDRTRSALAGALETQLPSGGAFTASAGVAVVKPHFPFHAAYELAHELRGEAKTASDGGRVECSSLSFHVLYDTSEYRLAPLRSRMEVPGSGPRRDRLYARPYVVGRDHPDDPRLARRTVQHLASRVRLARDETIPRSALAALREAAQRGRVAADDMLARLLAIRSDATGLPELAVSETGLFWEEDGVFVTDLLDLLEASEVWTPDDAAITAEQPQ
jgi:hypothetical protein